MLEQGEIWPMSTDTTQAGWLNDGETVKKKINSKAQVLLDSLSLFVCWLIFNYGVEGKAAGLPRMH